MIVLKNNTGENSRIGFIVTTSSRAGYFEYAGPGDDVIGVITEQVSPGKECAILSSGEALVYLHRTVQLGDSIMVPEAGVGAKKGACMPVGAQTSYTAIGTSLARGKGLVPVALNITSIAPTEAENGIPTGGGSGEYLRKSSTSDYDVEWATLSGGGDMDAATYDPTTVAGDAFDMDNMAEGTTNKILTAAERSLIASALQSETSHDNVVVEDYETVSKNLKSYPYAIAYGVDGISTMTYDLGGGDSIVKTFNYTTGVLTSIVLSGDVPGGIPLTKTLGYTGSDLTSITYS